MRILTRAILKEVSTHAVLWLVAFTFVIFIFTPHVTRLMELAVRHDLPAGETLELLALPLPGILVLTIPMAVLVGTLIGLSRMSADGEVVAARASGLGLRQFLLPVAILALAGLAASAWMSLDLGPGAGAALGRREGTLASSQGLHEIQPRVFIEQFPNWLLYIQDVTGPRADFRGVFAADTSVQNAPKITLAESGQLVNDPEHGRLVLHLEHGATHEIDPALLGQYSVGSFEATDIPLPMERGGALAERRTPATLPFADLVALASNPKEGLAARVELHYRFALPFASIVLALVGIPLGMSSHRGGKSVGVLFTMLLVFIYYILMALGLGFARQAKVPPLVGLWSANVLFAAVGIISLQNLGRLRAALISAWHWARDLQASPFRRPRPAGLRARERQKPRPSVRLLRILDLYTLRQWLSYLALLLVAFTGIYMIFDFFQLIGDVVRNHISLGVVLDYYLYLAPQVLFLMFPLSILVATLVCFGLLAKTNQVTAVKSAGISLHRLTVPVLAAALLASAAMFVLEDRTLPETNQRQDALRNRIKNRPAQTYLRPERQWIFGQSNRIFNYRYFEADQNVFGDLSVFEFDPSTFSLTRRIFARHAIWDPRVENWVLEQGWERDLEGGRVSSYKPFNATTFNELSEPPGYFKKEVRTSAQMSVFELAAYIRDLAHSGFDVVRLTVELYHKFAYPLMGFVIALIGVPFAFTTGSRGALTGIAASLGIAIMYWVTSTLFEAMGNLGQLPPSVAAWSPDLLFGLGGVWLLMRVKT
jgi:lipopolysaccharide export system permease protein